MYIDLIAVGKVKEKFYQEAIKEYLKRLSAYHKLTIPKMTLLQVFLVF